MGFNIIFESLDVLGRNCGFSVAEHFSDAVLRFYTLNHDLLTDCILNKAQQLVRYFPIIPFLL